MLFQNLDASDACHRLGYLSQPQFTREYGRFFGSPPTEDVVRLRDHGFAAATGARA
jgi:AraC-like DNA-binding protein